MATVTRSFGSSKREGHDSSAYYERQMQKAQISDDTTVNPPKVVNQFLCKSSEKMEEVADNSVALMVTSPPYNVGKDYDEDLSLDDYLSDSWNGFSERRIGCWSPAAGRASTWPTWVESPTCLSPPISI